MADPDEHQLILHLIAVTAIVLFLLFIVLEEIERLKRITAPRLVWVGELQTRNGPEAGETSGPLADAFSGGTDAPAAESD